MIDAQDRDCQTVIRQLNEPAEPDTFYWHLYCNGDKVNGGLTEGTITDAERCAEMYRRTYARSAVLASHAWDHETATWILKAELNLM